MYGNYTVEFYKQLFRGFTEPRSQQLVIFSANTNSSRLLLLVIVDVLCHLPDLHDVVLRDAADNPVVIRVPTAVRNLGSVTSMDEEELRRSVFSILRTLLLSNLGQIPDMQSAISARTCQYCFVIRRPLDLTQSRQSVIFPSVVHYLEDLVFVALEAVQLELEIPQVPQSHRLVG